MNQTQEQFTSWVDPEFYRNKYRDLQHLNDEQLRDHYFKNGYLEGRINSERHKNYILQNLDMPFYQDFYSDDDELANTEIIMPFPSVKTGKTQESDNCEKTLVIYAFHELNRYVRMFTQEGLFKDPLVDFIMVANIPGFDFSSMINLPSFVTTYTRENVGWDNGAYSFALFKNENYKKYKKFIFINSTVMGPYLAPYYPKPWTFVFSDSLVDDIHCFGTMINTEKDPLHKSHVQSCCFALTKEAVSLLIDAEIFSNDPNAQYSTHQETIMYKEILMSRMIISRGWNIGCLFPGFKGIDFRFKNKKPEDYKEQKKYLFAGDMMYPKFRYTVWDPYQIVFYKGNRFV